MAAVTAAKRAKRKQAQEHVRGPMQTASSNISGIALGAIHHAWLQPITDSSAEKLEGVPE
jgi:hypothetical protein